MLNLLPFKVRTMLLNQGQSTTCGALRCVYLPCLLGEGLFRWPGSRPRRLDIHVMAEAVVPEREHLPG